MLIEMVFFEGDQLLVRGEINCGQDIGSAKLESHTGIRFDITFQFEEPACPVSITCFLAGKRLYRAALRVGVHDSEDWESLELGENHVLAFRCYTKFC
jgi:hypothetical protein